MVIWSSLVFGLVFVWLVIHYVLRRGFMVCVLWILTLCFGFCGGLLVSGVYKLNFTSSAPQGLYRLEALSSGDALCRGDFAIITPDFLPEEHRKRYLPIKVPVMKRIVGLVGDTINMLSGQSLSLNGVSLGLNSIVLEKDSEGRPMYHPTYPVVVPPDSVWMMSDNALGYDSRYFGSVPLKAVLQRAFPVITW